jgi:hypothetical protein
MRERLVTAAGALLMLAVVYALVFEPPAAPSFTRPVSNETGRNGYAAVYDWLDGQGLGVASLRERFSRLLENDAPFSARGNVLVTTVPFANPMRRDEQRDLQRWIEAGNTVLVMAALDDTPEWSSGTSPGAFFGELRGLTGLTFATAEGPDGDGDPGGEPSGVAAPAAPIAAESTLELGPVEGHPIMAGVATLRGYSDEASLIWQVVPAQTNRPLLRLGIERDSGSDAIWETPRGDGQIIVVASGSALTNHVVAGGDARRFLANVVRYHLGAGGRVIFDDMHQGLSVLYDPDAFFADPRLHHTVWFLLAGWLAYLLGATNRFGPPRAPREAPQQGDFLEAVGGFMAGRLDRRDAGLTLLDEWFDDIRRARALPASSEPPWTALAATPTLSRAHFDELRHCYERLASGRAVDLVRLHNTLRQARKAIG